MFSVPLLAPRFVAPPTIRTRPSASSVAVWAKRILFDVPALVQLPIASTRPGVAVRGIALVPIGVVDKGEVGVPG